MRLFGPARIAYGGFVLCTALASACASTGTSTFPEPFPSLDRRAPAATSTPAGADAVVQKALSLRGTRYRLGGQDPGRGLDCSGLVLYTLGQFNITVPRTVSEQFSTGQTVEFDHIQAGDLLFFSTTKAGLQSGAATHVGISTGPASLGEFVHAPGEGGAVRVDRFDAPYWRARWVGARRVVPPVTR